MPGIATKKSNALEKSPQDQNDLLKTKAVPAPECNMSQATTDMEYIDVGDCQDDDLISINNSCSRKDEEPEFFKSSEMGQPSKLRAYLDKIQCDPFNHYCLNCKKQQSTHVLLWMGMFVCEGCSK